ncbi:MAG: glutamate-cysteine ligase family protein, partial [Beijerinckiaceae bacterium]
MARDLSDATPIQSRDELVEWFAAGAKPRERFRMGTEHEKVPYYSADNTPVPYEGPRGIRALLEGLQARTGWQPIIDGGNPIGLFNDDLGAAISLEPGGQFELSGAPLATVHETHTELMQHLAD